MRRLTTPWVAVGAAIVAAVTLASCSGVAEPAQTGTPRATTATATGTGGETPSTTPEVPLPLVVEADFDQPSLDPATLVERNTHFIAGALYQTLTVVDPAGGGTARPGLAEWTISPEGNWLTLRLRPGATFSDGSPITSQDVVFTLARARGLGGTASALLGPISSTIVDDRTLTLTSPGANFQLPLLLANPAFGILNADVVRANQTGASGDPLTDWLATHSAGSGPYVVTGSAPGASVSLGLNPHWKGPRPAFPEVQIRDATPEQQVKDIQSGAADIVLDVPPSDADTSRLQPSVRTVAITSQTSRDIAYLMLNQSSSVSPWTSNPDFVDAVHRGIDVAALTAIAGAGAQPALGLVPAAVLGGFTVPAPPTGETGTAPPGAPTSGPTAMGTPRSISPLLVPTARSPLVTPVPTGTNAPVPTVTPTAPVPPDLVGAKAALARSGYRGQPIPLSYARDRPIRGLDPAVVAKAVQGQLAEIGIRITLLPLPTAQARELAEGGGAAMGLWSWTPPFPDPEASLAFAPGGYLALRAHWIGGLNVPIDQVSEAARKAFGPERTGAFARWQLQMNESGAFVPLFQPGRHQAFGDRVKELPSTSVLDLDLAAVR